MKSFQRLTKYLRQYGLVRLSEDRQEQVSFSNAMNCLFFTILVQYLAANTWYFVFDAETFRDYVRSFSYLSYCVKLFAWYLMHFLNRYEYGRFFSELDGIIAQSKRKHHDRILANCIFVKTLFIIASRNRKQKSRIPFNLWSNSWPSGEIIAENQ